MSQTGKMNYNSLDAQGVNGQKRAKEPLTIEEMLDHVGFGLPQIRIIMVSGLVWVACGMELVVLSLLGPTLEYEWHITPLQQALFTTLVLFGICVGALCWGYVSDNYGRRTSLILSAFWTLLYVVLTAIAPSFIWILILKMLLGFGLGGSMHVTTYYTEILPGKYRGKAFILLLVFWAVGGLFAIVAALLLMHLSWRYWLLSSSVPTLIFIAFSMFIPESPRFELACGRKTEALKILSNMATGNGRVLPDTDLKGTEVKSKGNIAELIAPKFIKTSIPLGFIQFTFGFLYFGIVLFSIDLIHLGSTCSTDLTMTEEYSCSLLVQPLENSNYYNLLWTTSAEIPGLIVTLLIVDTLGRKMATILECLVVGLACLLLNICMPEIPMVILIFIGRGFSNSAFQIMLLYTNEYYPTEIRGVANGIASMCVIVGAMITPFIADVLFGWSLRAGLTVYGIASFIAVGTVFTLPNERNFKGRDVSKN